MDIKSFVKDSAEKERKNHYISNIMMTAVLGLIVILTLCFGVKVNIGSAYFGDNSDVYVRQNIFQVADVALNSNMEQDDAKAFVEKANNEMLDKYGVLGLEIDFASEGGNPAHEKMGDQFRTMVDQLGNNAHKINLLKYKLAYATAVEDKTSEEHKKSFDGHRIFAIAGQLILVSVAQFAVLVIALVMLVFAVLSLIKKKNNDKMRFAFILLSICAFFNIMLFTGANFLCMNWAGILVIVLTVLGATMLSLIRHALMDKRDFSFTMCVHNAVLLLGSIVALALFLSPLFKFTTADGVSQSFGWSYMYDYRLTVMASMSAVMSYTLSYILITILFLLPAALAIILAIVHMARFMSADYQHNEKRIFIAILLALSAIIFLILGVFSSGGELRITDLYINVKLNILPVILNLLVLGGMLAFEIMYKVKPIKKELVIR